MKNLFLLAVLSLVFSAAIAAYGQPDAFKSVPELEKNLNWLNTDKPLSLTDLRGKIVLLDFWTYGCINCLHVIPDLKKLEAKYHNELVIIGVHSGRYFNERDTENIRHVIFRFRLEHPIVNDADFKIWKSYGVEMYPTQVLIDPDGTVIAKTIGEKQLGLLDRIIGETILKFRANGKLDEKPMKFALERNKSTDSALLFPGKVLADAKSDRLFIADSNHNRIIVTKLDGTLLEIIGNGKATRADGDFAAASFNGPQGMTLDGSSLYVADTLNQVIRRIDLDLKRVETIAGTGLQGREERGGAAAETMLNSPWDLLLVGRQLFVAMAGNHQIWAMDLDKKLIAPFAGSGYEGRKDGSFETATFAQPSGLTFDDKNLYVADAESNLIRAVNLTERTVKTLAGADFYIFDDSGGAGKSGRLQHPLGLAAYGQDILIADTYNHKIRLLSPSRHTVKTLNGDGKYGNEDGKKARLYEPGGLSLAGDKLYIADTNNHAIRVLDLTTKQVSTLKIKGLPVTDLSQD